MAREGILNMKDEKQLKIAKIFCAICLIICIGGGIFTIVILNNTHKIAEDARTVKESMTETCSICGGKIVCAICGDTNALYCEYNDYGAGTDHYCENHYWNDVVPYHNKKNK